MRKLALLLLLSISACSSLRSKVENDVHTGDTYSEVVVRLGNPAQMKSFTEAPTQLGLIFVDRKDVCGVILDNYKVTDKACKANPSHVNPLATFLSAWGQSINANRPVNSTCHAHGSNIQCTSY